MLCYGSLQLAIYKFPLPKNFPYLSPIFANKRIWSEYYLSPIRQIHVYQSQDLKAIQMANAYPKKLNGLCIGVLSGDRVLFQGPPDKENGGYKQKVLHLTCISAPKLDLATGNEEKFAYEAREFLRARLVGKTLPFVVERKVNEIELGYVIYDSKDIIIELLTRGLAKLRGEKISSDHIDDYKDAEVEAQMAERGIWSEESKPEGAYRYLKKTWTDKEFFQKFKGQKLKGIVEQAQASKAIIYFPTEGFLTTLTYSEVQVVVLSEKLQNGESKNNVRVIRSVLQSSFLQKQVLVFVTSANEGLQGYFVNQQDEDVRKVLLKNGFAKLGKDAMNGISTKQFMELKAIAQVALQEGKGLWKEQKVVKSETLNSKSYMATVSEVNSGDSLTVYNQDKNEFVRIYLPNLRAPTNAQPFAYEAKQALRRRVIGQRVRVEVQFSKKLNVKKFEGDVGELKNFIFASIFENNSNISVYLLEQGFVTLQTPRVEQDVTKYFQALREAEAKGKKDRKGQFGNQQAKSPNFNDLSGGKGKKIDAGKCKNIFPFLKDEAHINGVVDLVLNGSRLKVRFNNQHVLAIMVLEGVRCLPNEGEFAKASEQALQYSKLNANQRDIEIELKSVDLKGIFHGKIYINKKDYALELLEKGLAVCMGGKFKNGKYEDAESIARKNKFGLWKYNLNLSSLRGEIEKEFKPVNFTKNLVLLQVANAEEFYLQLDGSKKPDVPQNPKPLTGNVEVGSLYAVKFSSDDQYYRGKIIKEQAGGKYSVNYVDYGNSEIVTKASIALLPENLKTVKSSLYKCSLYGVDSITAEGLGIIKDHLNVELKAEFKQESVPQGREDIEYRVILTQKNNQSINLQLLQYGEGECTVDNNEWKKAEEKARQLREGKWANEDN